MKGSIIFDINQVNEVFTLRAEGKTHEVIGKAMGCSAGFVAKVLSRENFGHFKLDEALVEMANKAVVKRTVRKKKTAWNSTRCCSRK